MPHSTKASSNRAINIPGQNASTSISAESSNEQNGSLEPSGKPPTSNNVHKSYNGNIIRQGGLQPTSLGKGQGMPNIHSGKQLINSAADPKSGGLRSGRNNQNFEHSLPLQQNFENSQKWSTNIQTQRSAHLNRNNNGIQSEEPASQFATQNAGYNRNNSNVLSAGGNKP